MITSNVGALSTQRLKSDALSQVQLKELVANIPSTKKLIVIDTCNAAALGDAIQAAMLTRGMSEDTAMKVLSRAVARGGPEPGREKGLRPDALRPLRPRRRGRVGAAYLRRITMRRTTWWTRPPINI